MYNHAPMTAWYSFPQMIYIYTLVNVRLMLHALFFHRYRLDPIYVGLSKISIEAAESVSHHMDNGSNLS